MSCFKVRSFVQLITLGILAEVAAFVALRRWLQAPAHVAITGESSAKPDIAPLQTTESALHDSQLFIQSIAEAIPGMLFVFDMQQNRIIYANHHTQEILGYSAAEIQQMDASTYGAFLPPDVFRQLTDLRRDLFDMADGEVVELECPAQHRDGSTIWLYSRYSVFKRDPQGLPWQVSGIAQDVTYRHQAEENLVQRSQELAVLSRRLVNAQETERIHIARELHDEIGQLLTGLKFSLDAVLRAPQDATRRVSDALLLVNWLIGKIREMSLNLRPAALDQLGLVPALALFVERYTDQTGIRVEVRLEEPAKQLPPEIEITAYRIVQEALTNVVRHAHAAKACVHLWEERGLLKLCVQDYGIGFDTTPVINVISSGLVGMRERAQLVGGSIKIESEPGEGTKIYAEMPMQFIAPDGQR